MTIATLVIAISPLAWLLPNHYFPWGSAWHEAVALLCATLALLLTPGATRLPAGWAALIAVGLVSVVVQWLTGRVFFSGDALMVVIYLLSLAAALAVGNATGQKPADHEGLPRPGREFGAAVDAYALGVLLAAVVSVGIAAVQWTGAVSLGMWQVDMPPGGRPFGNVAQPNHLCTIAALGLVSAGLLRQTKLIGSVGFWVAALWMVFGMVATSSRTGWLQIAALAGLALAYSTRAGVDFRRREALGLVAVYVIAVLVWPSLNGLMGVREGRPIEEFSQPGTRWMHWATLADAVTREPLWGYGWQQVGAAQMRVAELHPHVGEHIEHSHNLLLDLVVWAGLPAGLAMAGFAAYWLATRLRACRDGTSAWLLMGIAVLTLHAMLEFPLSYAYFLVPLGVMVGAVEARQTQAGGLRAPVIFQRAVAAGLLLMLGWIGADYLKAEQGYRLLRLESARIGTPGLQTPPPELQLLTQLAAFQRFVHTQARPGMSMEELEQMRLVVERYGYPPSMFRYALAAGLNGRSDVATLTLLRLCRIHPEPRCSEARAAWSEARKKFPGLQGSPPSAPSAP